MRVTPPKSCWWCCWEEEPLRDEWRRLSSYFIVGESAPAMCPGVELGRTIPPDAHCSSAALRPEDGVLYSAFERGECEGNENEEELESELLIPYSLP